MTNVFSDSKAAFERIIAFFSAQATSITTWFDGDKMAALLAPQSVPHQAEFARGPAAPRPFSAP